MKKTAIFAFATLLAAATPAFAITAEEWKADLDGQVAALKASMPHLTISGPITVTEESGMLKAQVPAAGNQDAKANWKTPPLVLTTAKAQTIVQDMTVVPQGSILVTDGVMTNDIRLQKLQLISDNVKNIRLLVDGMQSLQKRGAELAMVTVKRADIGYTATDVKGASLVQLFKLLQQKFGRDPVTASAKVEGISLTQDQTVLDIASLDARAQLQPQPDGKLVTVRNAINAGGITRTPADGMGLLMPKNLEMVGTVNNLPFEVLSGTGPQDQQTLKNMMAAAGTRLTIDTLKSTASSGIVMQGNGWLQSVASEKAAMTGRLALHLENLQEASVKMQQEMLNPRPGQSLAAQGQAMMTLMLLQSMAKQENAKSVYILEMNRDGQVLMNGQDISVLTRLFSKAQQQPPAGSPVQPGTNRPNP